MTRFGKLKETQKAAAVPEAAPTTSPSSGGKAREGKTMIGGYFSKEASKAVRSLALEEETTVQALVGEALDLLLRARGKHPLGER